MKQKRHIKKLIVAASLALSVQVAIASISFSGMTDEKSKGSKYSLKNLSLLSHRTLSLSTVKLHLLFKGSDVLTQKSTSTGLEINSLLYYNSGNTTYIMPYKFKVKVPKFKTPTAPIN
ncbi:hypothetical protein ACFOW1_08295 [Parasediminibacterium paludis]|uniref:Uncharacterized protein n=1 Tax=Parasediminibacterium paludis TaxID=908966 RepID=A0ABV8PVG3_9BACT